MFQPSEYCDLLNNSHLHSPQQGRHPHKFSDLPSRQLQQPLPHTQQLSPHFIPSDNDIPAPPIRQTERAIRIISPQGPASISMHALYHVINLAFNNPPGYTIPKNLTTLTNRFQHNINIEQVCNGVVHPITKETITKYTKLMDDPALKDLLVLAMSKELHRLVQGKEGVTVGTNTIFYLRHDEIKHIPKDRTVTYAQIVIDHRPQKDDLNRVRITVGGNLINYPYELTTHTADMVSA